MASNLEGGARADKPGRFINEIDAAGPAISAPIHPLQNADERSSAPRARIHAGIQPLQQRDQRDCLRSLNVTPAAFRARAVRCWQNFQSRLGRRLRENETPSGSQVYSPTVSV